jgi:RNA polymerase sigma factor (sigma-70 family)
MDADRAFAEFARTREPARLGEVFDACADDLFAVALHLCRDRAAAEDVVQGTFLVAMERAARWDPRRPLRPWLLGILHREARRARRCARRTVDDARVALPTEPSPPQRALAAEAARAVEGALGELPQPYRAVVELHVVHALAPATIAARLQRSPGAVRTQLWRGLELLRGLLPPGLALALGAELAANTPLAAVRERVLDAAATKATAAAGGLSGAVLLGAIAMKKMLLGAAALAAAVAAILLQASDPAASAPEGGAPSAPPFAVAASAPPLAPHEAQRVPRVPLDGVADAATVTTAAASADVAAPAAVEWPVVVVDTDGVPVADAVVARFDFARRPDGKQQASLERADEAPREVRRTDERGRAAVLVGSRCLVSATHEHRGWSGDVVLDPARTRPAELRLVLLPTATVTGRVLQPNGDPAHDARVHVAQPWLAPLGASGRIAPVRTDERGAFAVTVIAHEPLTVVGGYRRSATIELAGLRPGEVRSVELRLPGAFSLSGTVTDHEGRPLRATVRCFDEDPAAPRIVPGRATCDAEGRFQLLLARGGTLHVVAGVAGQTAAHARVELGDASPHATVALSTRPFVPITARVVDERGDPRAGLRVAVSFRFPADEELAHRTGAPALRTMRDGLHGDFAAAASDAQGRARFAVPADTRCQLLVQPLPGNDDLWVRSPELAAPAEDVLVVVRAADRHGFELHGRVVAARDGAPIGGARIERVTASEANASAGPVGGTSADGTFRLGPFRSGERYRFTFEADGFAKTTIGPFDATVRVEQVTVRMARCGSVDVQVLRADGTPAARAFASLQAAVHDPFGRAWQGDTDASGTITFTDVLPGPWRVHARATRAQRDSTFVDTVVHPEQTSSVQVLLGK